MTSDLDNLLIGFGLLALAVWAVYRIWYRGIFR